MKLDTLLETWLDKAACLGIAIILACTVYLFSTHKPQASASKISSPIPVVANGQQPAAITTPQNTRPPEIQTALDKSKGYFETGKYDLAIQEAEEILKKYPQESFAMVSLARAQLASGNMSKSLQNYSAAVKINPDFVDKNSPDKIGPELKTLVRDAVIEVKKDEFTKLPDYDETLKALYYLQRRLAGGCE